MNPIFYLKCRLDSISAEPFPERSRVPACGWGSLSSPLFFAVAYLTGFFILLTPIALFLGRRELAAARPVAGLKAALLPGICEFVATITYVLGLSLAKVAYVISVRRLSVLFGVFYGFVLFKESGLRERLAGTLLMLAGFVLIVCSR